MERISNARGRQVWLGLLVAAAAWLVLTHPGPARFDVPQVGIEEARSLIDSGAVVVDVRPKDRYDARHLPGALLLPLEVLREGIPLIFDVPTHAKVVVYCGEGTSRGPEATHLLREAGYANAVNLAPGIQGWADAGLPVGSV